MAATIAKACRAGDRRDAPDDLARRAIAASAALTAAGTAAQVNDAQYARIDHAAGTARRNLLDCLRQDHGIEETMADQLAALL